LSKPVATTDGSQPKPLPSQNFTQPTQPASAMTTTAPSTSSSAPTSKRKANSASVETGETATGKRKRGQQAQADDETDVLKMDAGSLQDVIQYAGVDLKAESEMIMNNVEMSVTKGRRRTTRQPTQDVLDKPPSTFQPYLKAMCKQHGLKKMESEVEMFLWMAAVERMKSIMEGSIQVSWQRVEVGRDQWQLDLLDGDDGFMDQKTQLDPANEGKRSRIGAVKRPLVWVEKFEKTREAKLAIEMKGSVSEEGRMAYLASAEAQSPNTTNAEGGEEGGKRTLKVGEDVVVRGRLANDAALRAAGLSSKYAWMNASATTSAAPASTVLNEESPTQTTQQTRRDATAMGGFGLPRPAQRQKILAQRRLQLGDVLFMLRHQDEAQQRTPIPAMFR
jgi:hypothetical protein